MHSNKTWKKAVISLGLAMGMHHMATAQVAAETFTGTYSGGDTGTVSITIAQDDTVSCSITSATGKGTYTGVGTVWQRSAAIMFGCSHLAYPMMLSLGGTDVLGADTLSGDLAFGPSEGVTSTQARFKAKRSSAGTVDRTPLNTAAITGLWYDPATNGTGFNLIAAENGFFATYYGRNAAGGPLWLISTEVPTGTLRTNTPYTTILGATTAGTFSQPAYAVETWGQLDITFQSCNRATATLAGKDGTQKLNLQRLTTIAGADKC